MSLPGTWELDPADERGLAAFGNILLVIHEDGRLDYVILEDEKAQVMRLTYLVDGDCLVTDQPSAPKVERTRFRLDGDTLLLALQGQVTRFRRTSTPAPT